MNNPNNPLYNSIHNWADRFYNYLLKHNIVETDFEFGSWDHFWLSAMISMWIEDYQKNYGESNHRENSKVFRRLARGFLSMAKGNNQDNNEKYRVLFENFQKYYLHMWD